MQGELETYFWQNLSGDRSLKIDFIKSLYDRENGGEGGGKWKKREPCITVTKILLFIVKRKDKKERKKFKLFKFLRNRQSYFFFSFYQE